MINSSVDDLFIKPNSVNLSKRIKLKKITIITNKKGKVIIEKSEKNIIENNNNNNKNNTINNTKYLFLTKKTSNKDLSIARPDIQLVNNNNNNNNNNKNNSLIISPIVINNNTYKVTDITNNNNKNNNNINENRPKTSQSEENDLLRINNMEKMKLIRKYRFGVSAVEKKNVQIQANTLLPVPHKGNDIDFFKNISDISTMKKYLLLLYYCYFIILLMLFLFFLYYCYFCCYHYIIMTNIVYYYKSYD